MKIFIYLFSQTFRLYSKENKSYDSNLCINNDLFKKKTILLNNRSWHNNDKDVFSFYFSFILKKRVLINIILYLFSLSSLLSWKFLFI